jgi:hypothetical protein
MKRIGKPEGPQIVDLRISTGLDASYPIEYFANPTNAGKWVGLTTQMTALLYYYYYYYYPL